MAAAYRLLLRTTATRGRVLLGAGLGLLIVLGAMGAATQSLRPREDIGAFLAEAGLALLAPVVAVVFASATLGDPAEDGTLVYLWLRPVPRWQLVLPALGVALTLSTLLVLTPLLLASVFVRDAAGLALPAVVAGGAAVAAYSALALPLGLRSKRALMWGVAYAVIWEGGVARAGAGLAAVSIRRYTTSLFAELADLRPPAFAVTTATAATVLVIITLVMTALAIYLLRRQQVA